MTTDKQVEYNDETSVDTICFVFQGGHLINKIAKITYILPAQPTPAEQVVAFSSCISSGFIRMHAAALCAFVNQVVKTVGLASVSLATGFSADSNSLLAAINTPIA